MWEGLIWNQEKGKEKASAIDDSGSSFVCVVIAIHRPSVNSYLEFSMFISKEETKGGKYRNLIVEIPNIIIYPYFLYSWEEFYPMPPQRYFCGS